MADQPVATSVLSDGTIRRLVEAGQITIDPWDPAMVQPASVDLRLGHTFRVFHNHRVSVIDLREPPVGLTEQVEVGDDEPFVIHPGEFVLGRTMEYVELPADVVARIEGKALALDTEVPTPTGWTTMGELRVGDEVFGPLGQRLPVVDATEVLHGRPCREVEFSDGTVVRCDASHQWPVRTKYDRVHDLPPRVLTTDQIARSLKYGREFNHHVEQTASVDYPSKALTIDPYVMGAWIGDGTSANATLTTADPEILAEVAGAGHGVRKASGRYAYLLGSTGAARDPRTGRYGGGDSLQAELRRVGVLGNKHLPDAYLQSSIHQRFDLLEGLMDTDGYVDRWGRCELTTTKHHLALQYRELIASLGLKPVIETRTATLYGKQCGLKHDVTFTPHKPVFRLARKLDRQKTTGRFKFGRSIVAVREVPSEPVRCIQVGHPDGTFLVTRAFVPTHNSSLGRLGLIVHATAGFCDPGWRGTLTLELTNLTRVPIRLYAGAAIAQLSFMTLDRAAERPYGSPGLGSHYAGQVEATESRYESADGRPPGRDEG